MKANPLRIKRAAARKRSAKPARGTALKRNPYERVGARRPKQATMAAIASGKYDRLRHWLDGVRAAGFTLAYNERDGRPVGRATAYLAQMRDLATSYGAKIAELDYAEAQGRAEGTAKFDAVTAKAARKQNPVAGFPLHAFLQIRKFAEALILKETGAHVEVTPSRGKRWTVAGSASDVKKARPIMRKAGLRLVVSEYDPEYPGVVFDRWAESERARAQRENPAKRARGARANPAVSADKVIRAFLDGKEATSKQITSSGVRLDGNWTGGRGLASWQDGKIKLGYPYGNVTQSWLKKIARMAPAYLLTHDSWWALPGKTVKLLKREGR